ncbi:MAG: serine hydrolase domain-containing protein [Pyrinomonadaceae bacterium]
MPFKVTANDVVKKLITEANKKGEFSGVVAASRNGKRIFAYSIGFADSGSRIKIRRETKFRISSITKQFTTVLLLQLVEEGKVDLDKPVANYVDVPEARKNLERITARQLLSGSSMLPWLESEDFYQGTDADLTDARFVVKTYMTGDLRGEPGSKFGYNNADFILAEAIIESVSGKSYEALLKEKVLDPLGMKNSGVIARTGRIKGLAKGFIFEDGSLNGERYETIANYGGSGAMYSTVGDMLKWNNAILYNSLIKRDLRDEMFSPSEKLGFVGLGSWIYDLKLSDTKTVRVVERQGGIGGFSAVNLILPDEEFSIIFLSNVRTGTLSQTYASKGLSYQVLREFLAK